MFYYKKQILLKGDTHSIQDAEDAEDAERENYSRLRPQIARQEPQGYFLFSHHDKIKR